MAEKPTNKKKFDVDVDELKAQINLLENKLGSLTETYKTKCVELSNLTNAYNHLLLDFNKAGENTKTFINAAYLGINSIFKEGDK